MKAVRLMISAVIKPAIMYPYALRFKLNSELISGPDECPRTGSSSKTAVPGRGSKLIETGTVLC